MADITECGVVTVIRLKKCGSSQIRKAFAEKTWQHRQFGDSTPRYVTAFRNPAHRLVSCWNHLIRGRVELPPDYYDPVAAKKKFGPHLDFPEWCEWVIDTNHEDINMHMRMQTYELADHLRDTDGLIWIGQLERMQELAKNELTEWLKWSVAMPNKQRHPYKLGTWPNYYPPGLLRKVHRRFATDYKLWMNIYGNGCEVFHTGRLSETLDLTNGRHSCMM